MVPRGLRFLSLVAVAAVCSIQTAYANGSTSSAGAGSSVYAQAGQMANPSPTRRATARIDAGCDPRAYLAKDVDVEDLPDIVRLAYLKRMSPKEYEDFMKSGGNSQIIKNKELPVILSFAEFRKLVRYEMEHRNIKIYTGRYDYLFRSSLSPIMERAYIRCIRDQHEPFLDVKIEPDAFEPFGTNESQRRIFIRLAWFGTADLSNVRLTPRGDLIPEPNPPTGMASDNEPGAPPGFDSVKPGESQDATLIFKQNPDGTKSFLAISADGIESKLIAFYQMGLTSVSFVRRTKQISAASSELNGFLQDVQQECLSPNSDEGEFFISTARTTTLQTPQTAKGRVSSVVLKDPQPVPRQVCFEARATAPRKGARAEGTATLEVWEITAP